MSVYELAADAFSGNYEDLTNKPSIPTKTSDLTNDSGYITGVTWNEVTGKPTFAAVATSGDYDDLLDKPDLSTVATSGSYNDLSNKPTIPVGIDVIEIERPYSTLTAEQLAKIIANPCNVYIRLSYNLYAAESIIENSIYYSSITLSSTSGSNAHISSLRLDTQTGQFRGFNDKSLASSVDLPTGVWDDTN